MKSPARGESIKGSLPSMKGAKSLSQANQTKSALTGNRSSTESGKKTATRGESSTSVISEIINVNPDEIAFVRSKPCVLKFYEAIIEEDLETEEVTVPTWIQYGLRCKSSEISRFEKQKQINEEQNLFSALKQAEEKEVRGFKQKGRFAMDLKPDITYRLDRTWHGIANPIYNDKMALRDKFDRKMLEAKRKQAMLLDKMTKESIKSNTSHGSKR